MKIRRNSDGKVFGTNPLKDSDSVTEIHVGRGYWEVHLQEWDDELDLFLRDVVKVVVDPRCHLENEGKILA